MTTFPNVACVGMHFRGPAAVDAAAQLEPGSTLTLIREPDNAFDAYAIKVMLEDLHLGYIERGQAAWISPLLDDGSEATATVTHIEQRGKNHHPILTIEVE
jgi:hypothetical protein